MLTDFGTRDWYVGAMKGVISSIAPSAPIIDITHGIRPGGVREGAFALRTSFQCFPEETVFVVVVDPGVGSDRKAIAVRAGGYYFVAPDNGVLSFVMDICSPDAVHQVDNKKYFRSEISTTFHGRDIFAPVGAHLARGVALKSMGRESDDWLHMPWPASIAEGDTLVGEIVYIDRFGNAITSLDSSLCARFSVAKATVQGRATPGFPMARYYQETSFGNPLCLIGSSGLLELSINGESAAEKFGLEIGDRVALNGQGA